MTEKMAMIACVIVILLNFIGVSSEGVEDVLVEKGTYD